MNNALKAIIGMIAVMVLGMIFAPSASAATMIYLKDAHQNVTAADFDKHGEALIPGTNDPAPTNVDAWHFIIPGGQDNEFLSLHVEFTTPDGEPQTVDTIVFQQQANQAYVLTPPGWTLVDASGTATGGDEIVLSHTRPATTVVTPPVDEELTCDDEGYAAGHQDECNPVPPVEDCSDADYAAGHQDECNPVPPVVGCEDDDYAAGHQDECNPVVTPPVVTPPVVTPPTVTPVVTPPAVLAATGALPHTGGSLAPLTAAILLTLAGASLATVARRKATV